MNPKTILSLLIMVVLVSCQSPGGVGKVTYAYDNTESFRDGALAATALALGLVDLGATKSADAVKSVTVKEGTKTTLGAQSVEKFTVGEETKRFLHSTPNPNIK